MTVGQRRHAGGTGNKFSSGVRSRLWLEWNPEKVREVKRNSDARRGYVRARLLKQYGLSQDDYDSLLKLQDGVCRICEQGDTAGRHLSVDHDHDSGRVRGLLCGSCNKALGLLGDDPHRLMWAATYLLHEKG